MEKYTDVALLPLPKRPRSTVDLTSMSRRLTSSTGSSRRGQAFAACSLACYYLLRRGLAGRLTRPTGGSDWFAVDCLMRNLPISVLEDRHGQRRRGARRLRSSSRGSSSRRCVVPLFRFRVTVATTTTTMAVACWLVAIAAGRNTRASSTAAAAAAWGVTTTSSRTATTTARASRMMTSTTMTTTIRRSRAIPSHHVLAWTTGDRHNHPSSSQRGNGVGTTSPPRTPLYPSSSSSSALFSSSSLLAASLDSASAHSPSSSYGAGMDQQAMMETDRLIAVDENDRIVVPGGTTTTTCSTDGSDSASFVVVTKKDGHRFDAMSPRGILHRAFSVFVFDQEDRLLLTQRASTKITFPNVWTNACCSHPLHGMVPNEVDHYTTEDEVLTDGIKNAVVRKLQHELGISPTTIDKDRLVFVKRFHYWASDTITYGNDSPWGEHEVDYVFFYRAPVVVVTDDTAVTADTAATAEFLQDHEEDRTPTPRPLTIRPNLEEVATYEFVTKAELMRRMRRRSSDVGDEEEVLWSPWFVGIMERGGFEWWDDMEQTLHGKYTSNKITYFDPPARHVAAYNLPHHGRTTGVANLTGTSAANLEAAATTATTKSPSDPR